MRAFLETLKRVVGLLLQVAGVVGSALGEAARRGARAMARAACWLRDALSVTLPLTRLNLLSRRCFRASTLAARRASNSRVTRGYSDGASVARRAASPTCQPPERRPLPGTKDGTNRVVRRFPTKEAATKGGALEKALGMSGGSVKIRNEDGRFEEERTFPRGADPRESEG